MQNELSEYMKVYKGTPWGRNKNASVRRGDKRIEVAEKQRKQSPVSTNAIISHTMKYLSGINVKTIDDPKQAKYEIQNKSVNYKEIVTNKGAASEKHLIWMKFTRSGHLVCVAKGNDINFDMPQTKGDRSAKYPTSGIIIKEIGEEFDSSFVLAFPLIQFPNRLKVGDIERGVGNYLILEHNIPILDFYSHNY